MIFDADHRKKFYLHSFLLEGIILVTAILFDSIQKASVPPYTILDKISRITTAAVRPTSAITGLLAHSDILSQLDPLLRSDKLADLRAGSSLGPVEVRPQTFSIRQT